MAATSQTIVRMWTKDGYHKDVLVIDSDQVRMHNTGINEPDTGMMFAGGSVHGPSMVVDPSKFPEAVCFQIIVTEYKKR